MFIPGHLNWFLMPNGELPLKIRVMKVLKPRLHWSHAYTTLKHMNDIEEGVHNTIMKALKCYGEYCPNENHELCALMNLWQDLRCTSK